MQNVLLFCSVFVAVGLQAGEGELEALFGKARLLLVRAQFETSHGPIPAEDSLRQAARLFLTDAVQPPEQCESMFTHKTEGADSFDGVAFMFQLAGKQARVRMTPNHLCLTVGDQETGGKTNEELSVLLATLAQQWIRDFGTRNFTFHGATGSSKVFYAVPVAPQQRNYQDTVRALVEGTTVSFVFRREDERSARATSDDWDDVSRTWFAQIGYNKQGQKKWTPAWK